VVDAGEASDGEPVPLPELQAAEQPTATAITYDLVQIPMSNSLPRTRRLGVAAAPAQTARPSRHGLTGALVRRPTYPPPARPPRTEAASVGGSERWNCGASNYVIPPHDIEQETEQTVPEERSGAPMRPPSGRTRHRPDQVATGWIDSAIAVDLVAGKWTPGVIEILSTGPRRYGELLNELDGVADKMLTYTLHRMVRNGLIAQRLVRRGGTGVAGYAITPLGRSLREPLAAMGRWTRLHRKKLPVRSRRPPGRRE